MRFGRLCCLLVLAGSVQAEVRVLHSDASGVLVRYLPGEVELLQSPDGVVEVRLADGDQIAGPGQPDLPGKAIRVGIPQAGEPSIAVRAGPSQTYRVRAVRSVEQCGRLGPAASPAAGGGGATAELRSTEVVRGVRCATLVLRPATHDAGQGLLTVSQWIEVRVSFSRAPREVLRPDPLDSVLGRMMVNGQEAIRWKLDPPPARARFFARSPHWLRIEVVQNGIHVISGRDMRAAGVSLEGIDPRTLSMYTIGERSPGSEIPDTMVRVPIRVTGEQDGRLDEVDRLHFYARAADHWSGCCTAYVRNPYTDRQVYWLSWGGVAGARMPQGLGPDTTGWPVVTSGLKVAHVEQDLDCPARSGLLWIWKRLSKEADSGMVAFGVDPALGYPMTLHWVAGRLYSETSGNDIELAFNQRTIGRLSFGSAPPNAPYDFRVECSEPASSRRNGLQLRLVGTGAMRVYLDYLEIGYATRLSLRDGQLDFIQPDTGVFRFQIRDAADSVVVLDITNPVRPAVCDGVILSMGSAQFCRRVLRSARFVVAEHRELLTPASIELRSPGRLADAARRADYWIVTPTEFKPAVQRLVHYRQAHVPGLPGATVAAAPLEEIYDDYGLGAAEPWAIKLFLADKRPSYGLLVGDATYDYRNNLGRERPPHVPTYEVGLGLQNSAYDRNTAAFDAWFADFEGQGGSPDMILGRVTARSAMEFSGFVDKLVAYEHETGGAWTRRYLLLADDEWEGSPDKPDPIGFNHIDQAEGMAALGGHLLEPRKVYLTEYPYAGVKHKPGASAELMRELNRGALVFVFFGHGDAFDLTHEGVLNIAQIGDLTNGYRAPVSFFGSCGVGRFEDTRYECIAEELVRSPEGGAIIAIGATKATTSGANLVFARNLLVPLFGQPDSTIGAAFFNAWPTDRIYHLFGDPATRLRLPRGSTQALAVQPDTLRPGSRLRVQSIVEAPRGRYAWSLFGPRRLRRYVSQRGTVDYLLSGSEFGRGGGELRDGRIWFATHFPMGVALDTVYVGDGHYAPVPKSCRVSVTVIGGDASGLTVVEDTIPFGAEAEYSDDHEGPVVSWLSGGRPLEDGVRVASDLELECTVSDPSGILIAPVPGAEPRLFPGSSTEPIDLTDRLVFDDSMSTTARFRVRLRLDHGDDTLSVSINDNLLNRTWDRVSVVVTEEEDRLALDSVLVYPNPVRRAAWICFVASRPAIVQARVFTIAGRLVRNLGERAVAAGYGQVAWDGLDGQGRLLANGVYLLQLRATVSLPGRNELAVVRERFLVAR